MPGTRLLLEFRWGSSEDHIDLQTFLDILHSEVSPRRCWTKLSLIFSPHQKLSILIQFASILEEITDCAMKWLSNWPYLTGFLQRFPNLIIHLDRNRNLAYHWKVVSNNSNKYIYYSLPCPKIKCIKSRLKKDDTGLCSVSWIKDPMSW